MLDASGLSPEQIVKDAFFCEVFLSNPGTIEDGDGTVGSLSFFGMSNQNDAAAYGCPAGELALVVDWYPHNGEERSPEQPLAVFPRTFRGMNVYYLRRDGPFVIQPMRPSP